MENEMISPSAYYESGRVVFTYLNGYYCDRMEIDGSPSGKTGSLLNAGNDLPFVKAVLSGDPSSLSEKEKTYAITVAKKLMVMYCAGSCTAGFFENDERLPEELNMQIPATDMKHIENIQRFLSSSILDHPADYPAHAMMSVFKNLQDHDIRNGIKALAERVSQNEQKSLTGFYIEDTLMPHGIKRVKETHPTAFSVGVSEEKTPKKEVEEMVAASPKPEMNSPLDITLQRFLKLVKTDWNEGEIEASIDYLKSVFKDLG